MKPLLTFFAIIIAGCVVAGFYGIVHDQLTYTISPEYYTKFKFYQFGLVDEGMSVTTDYPRLWVGLVGFLATWWMGIPIATIIAIFSFQSNWKRMTQLAARAMVITIVVAVVTGLYGLYRGFTHYAHEPRERLAGWFIPPDLIDFENFIAVGSMHNFSYLGGAYGLVCGVAYILWKRGAFIFKRQRTSLPGRQL